VFVRHHKSILPQQTCAKGKTFHLVKNNFSVKKMFWHFVQENHPTHQNKNYHRNRPIIFSRYPLLYIAMVVFQNFPGGAEWQNGKTGYCSQDSQGKKHHLDFKQNKRKSIS